MTYTQYTYNNGYRSPSNSALNSHIPLIQDYVQFATGTNSYVLITGDYENGSFHDATVYELVNDGTYMLEVSNQDTVSIRVTNEYYTYSNVLSGQSFYNQSDISAAYADSLIGFLLSFGLIILCIFNLIFRRFKR